MPLRDSRPRSVAISLKGCFGLAGAVSASDVSGVFGHQQCDFQCFTRIQCCTGVAIFFGVEQDAAEFYVCQGHENEEHAVPEAGFEIQFLKLRKNSACCNSLPATGEKRHGRLPADFVKHLRFRECWIVQIEYGHVWSCNRNTEETYEFEWV